MDHLFGPVEKNHRTIFFPPDQINDPLILLMSLLNHRQSFYIRDLLTILLYLHHSHHPQYRMGITLHPPIDEMLDNDWNQFHHVDRHPRHIKTFHTHHVNAWIDVLTYVFVVKFHR